MIAIIRHSLRCALYIAKDTRGATAVMVALLMTAIIGFAGLGAETGLWFTQKRGYQTAADAGALAGAWQLADQLTASNGKTFGLDTSSTGHAFTEAVNNGAPNSTSNIAVTPLSGPPAAQVVVTVRKQTLLASLFMPIVTLKTSAIASTQATSACDLALAKSGTGITLAGGSTLGNGCSLAADSTSCDTKPGGGSNTSGIVIQDSGFSAPSGMTLYTQGCVFAQQSQCAGTNSIACVGGSPNFPDPFASEFKNFAMPATPCSASNTFVSGVYHYGSIKLTGSGTVTLDSNQTYYIDGACKSSDGSLTANNVTINGTNVTIIATGAMTIKSAGTLSAPTGDPTAATPYPGVLFYQPTPSGKKAVSNTITGSADNTLTGAIYMPGSDLVFTGDESSSGCFETVTLTLTLTGNGSVATCSTLGVATPTIYTAILTQ